MSLLAQAQKAEALFKDAVLPGNTLLGSETDSDGGNSEDASSSSFSSTSTSTAARIQALARHLQ